MLSRGLVAGIAVSALLVLAAVLLFFQTADPMVLILVTWPIFLGWGIGFLVYVLRRGIPIRIVADERKGP